MKIGLKVRLVKWDVTWDEDSLWRKGKMPGGFRFRW